MKQIGSRKCKAIIFITLSHCKIMGHNFNWWQICALCNFEVTILCVWMNWTWECLIAFRNCNQSFQGTTFVVEMLLFIARALLMCVYIYIFFLFFFFLRPELLLSTLAKWILGTKSWIIWTEWVLKCDQIGC